MKTLRWILAVLAWAFVAAIVVQTFFAGMMLFGVSGGSGLHEGTGWILHLTGFLIAIVAAVARAGLRTILLSVGLALITYIQPLLATAFADTPAVAALHPVNALLIFGLGIAVALRATALARTPARAMAASA